MTLDLLQLDAQVKQAALSFHRWRLLPDAASAKDHDPFVATRTVTGQSLLKELRAHKPSAFEVELHRALERWVYALLQARLSIPHVLETRVLIAKRVSVPAFSEELTWPLLWKSALTEPKIRAGEYAKALGEIAPALIDIGRRAVEVKIEVARRVGYDHPDQPFVREGDIEGLAQAFVSRTSDLSRDLAKANDEVSYLTRELARDAREGWPGKLTPRWFEEVFAGLSIKRLPAMQLPAIWGASSFARALCILGLTLRHYYTSQSKLPFAVRVHPRDVEGHTIATAFSLLLTQPAFHFRVLGVSRDTARDQARQCASALLLSSRRQLASQSVRADTWAVDDASSAVFCGRDPSPLTRALLYREPTCLEIADGISFSNLLVNRFDEDWFRNPRAHQFLIDRASAPAFATDRTELPTAIQCAEWFESRV